jgi:hypothetical protein
LKAEDQARVREGTRRKRAKKGSARIDMTPMVDVAFLLLTFFVLTTTMYKPSTLKIAFPVPPDQDQPPPPVTKLSQCDHPPVDQEGSDLLLLRGDSTFPVIRTENRPPTGASQISARSATCSSSTTRVRWSG